ncbi:MAG: chitobiase/beta-hexosaminidase C-terminal domain-containing protein [Planctomycetota bacterium]|nr:chitobiase/beta-hexosaminidase C-terminal domain-containing protein [Planctomycetota bacterium]
MEAMEPRLLLASTFSITEFMADNTKTLADKDGAFSDWIEINNSGLTAANLNGYYLTDSAANLTKWRFPSVNVPAGGYVVVFASDKNITTGAELHTNFKLDAGGEYLALVEPDGHTIASEFSPQYPQQYEDISYGYGQDILTKTLVGPNVPAAAYVPPTSALGLTWTNWSFNDSSWTLRGNTGVGYESVVPGFAVRDYMGNFYVSTLAEAESVITTPMKRRDQTVYTENAPYVNYLNNGDDAHFGSGRNLPGVTPPYTYWENIVSEATGWIVVPSAGLYTFGVSSDDGFGLTITGATTTWVTNASTPAGSNVLDYQASRGPGDTWGTFNFPAAGRYPVRFVWFQGTGGAEVELFAAPGDYRAFNYTDYKLVGDTANGGLAVESLPVASGGVGTYASVIQTNIETAMKGVNASAYVRVPFTLTDLTQYNSLTLKMKYDDGFVAYLNGVKVAWRNAPGSPLWNSSATAEHAKSAALVYEEIDVSSRLNLLRVGQNVLAIQGLNYGAGDTDFLVLPELVDVDYLGLGLHYFATGSPRAANLINYYALVADTKFDHDRGFYDAPFDLAITTSTPDATIRYTTDGSLPTATTGTVYAGPIPITATTILRAAGFKTGYEPSNVDTQTYIFLGSVLTQPNDPEGFPTTWGLYNGTPFAADYEMDPNVVNDPAYSAEILDDLKSLPTMSIVTTMDNMFGPGGLYSNTWTDKLEMPGSLELIYPDGTKGFQQDAGIRIYGGVGRDTPFRKHSFRILFKDQYGDTKLHFPLFDDSPMKEFDSIILRANFNDAWVWGGSSAQYMVDEWSRRAQLDMGGLASHGTYVHLFINGLYWGLYNPA